MTSLVKNSEGNDINFSQTTVDIPPGVAEFIDTYKSNIAVSTTGHSKRTKGEKLFPYIKYYNKKILQYIVKFK